MVALDVFVKCISKVPDMISGDAFWYAEQAGLLWMLVVDGLGFGPEAAEAARLAVVSISNDVKGRTHPGPIDDRALKEMVRRADELLRASRGAALGLALFEPARSVGRYVGIGNIELRVVGPLAHAHPICTPGIVGAGLRSVRVEAFSYQPGQLILMHSDGLSSRFDLDPQVALGPSLEELGESLVAAHGKKDDLTVLLVKQRA
jgi:hypothetical protein